MLVWGQQVVEKGGGQLFYSPPKMVAPCGGGWALRRYATILTTNNCTILFGLLSTHLHRFQVIEFNISV